MKNNELEVTLKVTEGKGLILGRTYILFDKPRVAVGLWDNSVVFANEQPQTLRDCGVLIYTIEELKDFAKEDLLKGLVDLEENK